MEHLSDYGYDLPERLIAQTPLADRSASRLLWLHRGTGEIEDRRFTDIVDILHPDDLLIWNDTRVTAVRLNGHKLTGGAVEFLLLKETSEGVFEALIKPAKRLPTSTRVDFGNGLAAIVRIPLEDPVFLVEFDRSDGWRTKLYSLGRVPLPPYIHTELPDSSRYQTVYASAGGSAAAPTAGLHFTPQVLERIRKKGIQTASVTLDVSLDTFRPVKVESLDQHIMHGEICRVPQSTADAVAECKGRIIAVGTTSARTLESFSIGHRKIEVGEKNTKLFIRPGYRFSVLDGLLTNFHLPQTTMLMMISALANKSDVFQAYAHATQQGYRFLSFGDAMLIL